MDKKTITFEEVFNQIPDKILESFTKRSIRDTKELLGENFKIDESELADISYTIYRAYCIGYAIGKISK